MTEETRPAGARNAAGAVSAQQPALEIEGLAKSYPAERNALGRVVRTVDAVRGVDIAVAPGETVALVGESGAGKSTVGRLALRLIQPDSGRISVLGQDIMGLGRKELKAIRSRATMIFQDPYKSLDPKALIRYSVAEPLLAQGGTSRDEREEKVSALMDRVGLAPHYLDRYPYEMSGGQLQRVAIARALSTGPEVVVCDEPVAALDMSIRSHVINLLRELQRERGLAYLFISHDMSLVRVIADRVAVMRKGRIIECATTGELFEDPAHEYTRELLSAIPASHPARRTFRPVPRTP